MAAQQRTAEQLRELAEHLDNPEAAYKINKLAGDISALRHLAARPATTTARLLEAVRDDIGLGEALEERLDASRHTANRPSHGDDLRALISVAGLHPRPAGFAHWLTQHLSEPAENTPGGVRLATVHKVKGLEWPHVIVYDATEGLMPHILAEDLEEERRVFHVAITRCSESVTVICGEDSSPYPAETRSPARKTRTPGPAGPPAPAGSRRTPGKQPTTAAPVSERVQPTHPGTSWPVPTGQKKPRQDGSRSRRTRR